MPLAKTEKDVDRALVAACKERGILQRKFGMVKGFGSAGWPDRELFYGGGTIVFVECKAPGKEPTVLQVTRHEQLRALGFIVYIYSNTGIVAARDFLDEIEERLECN